MKPAVAPMPEQRRRRSPAVPKRARDAFLEAIAAGWSTSHAAERAGVHRRRLYELRESDEDFAAAWLDAEESGKQVLEDEVRRRGVDGWDEPVYQRGELVGMVRRYSDNLLMFLLKKRDPSYRDNARVEVTGRDGGPIEVEPGFSPAKLSAALKLLVEGGDVTTLAGGDVVDSEAVEVEPPALEAGS